MKKGTLSGILFGLLTFGALYFIFTNQTLVFEIFEGKSEHRDAFDESISFKTAPVSLGAVINGESALTLRGYFKLMIVMVGIPFIVGVFVSWRIRRKMRKAMAMNQIMADQNS